jgi:hypothetical protein
MLSPLRNRFGIPGVISVVALVFAMLGGAYAANNSGDGKATASAKAKKGPRGPKGATGPAGPAGPQGPAGANGKDGANGANGSNGEKGATGSAGAAGKSVNVAEIEPGNPGCEERGGAEVKQEDAGSGIELCNGKEGSPWVVGAAPTGALLRGTWSAGPYDAQGPGEGIHVPLSTGVPVGPLEIPLAVKKGENLPAQSTQERQEAEEVCTGDANNPLPPSPEFVEFGFNSCIYVSQATNLIFNGWSDSFIIDSGGGAVARFASFEEGIARGYGSWVIVVR